ncbi:acyl-CoA dehydrogenase [Serratia marcescens]|uniref:acyl-CoA dehydrogenase n=1 Tax=Serratia marcescens TaxID=615 RepID=UPI001C5A169D|nr:acyl-CoA dehydrogenase [Serratia marcescens]QXX95812.1 acyl-CoA dehydrogenase [Serratia marcescens]
MTTLYELTRRHEVFFGDPNDSENIFSYRTAHDYDVNSAFPQGIIDQLNSWGLSDYYVPLEFGGKLKGYDELFHLIRLASRRDLTSAIGHGKTMLGAICVWIGGSRAQRQWLADAILCHKATSLALTEQSHGSDISASHVLCNETPQGYRLNGEKYLINNARRAASLTVFARTAANNNARDFSIFLIDKTRLPEDALSYVPKLLTHGIKGADISGVRFHNVPLPTSALVGKPGQGLEIMLCGFQLTRTLCTGLSCGAGESALRLALRYAAERQVYRAPLIKLANIRRRLAEAAADVLIADAVGLFSCRAINVLPQQMSTISAAAKAFVPTSIEDMVDGLVEVLGARAYLEDDGEYGHFGKLQRDCRLISLFDGNTVINLQALIVQLPALARQRRRNGPTPDTGALLGTLFGLDEPLQALEPQRLKLSGKGQDAIVQSLFSATQQLSDVEGIPPAIAHKLNAQVRQVLNRLAQVDDFFLKQVPRKQISAQCFAMAELYTHIFAAACCIQSFIVSHRRMAAEWRDGTALSACLDRLNAAPLEADDALLQRVQNCIAQDRLISFFPLPLAATRQGATS